MRKRKVASIAFTGATAAAATGFAAPSAFAQQSHWTISPGGPYTAQAGVTSLENFDTGAVLSCPSAFASGSLYGDSTSGTPAELGSIASATFGNSNSLCNGPFGLTFTAQKVSGTSPWHINGYDYSNGVTVGTITSVSASIDGVGNNCHAVVTGSVPGSYNNATDQLTVYKDKSMLPIPLPSTVDPTLHVKSASNCLGLLNASDSAGFSGTYTVSPPQTIIHEQ